MVWRQFLRDRMRRIYGEQTKHDFMINQCEAIKSMIVGLLTDLMFHQLFVVNAPIVFAKRGLFADVKNYY